MSKENDVIKDRYLTRLIRAYPAQAEVQLHRVPPLEAVSSVEEVFARFHDATANPMRKAIAIAVMLDQDGCCESRMDKSTRQVAAQLFEEIFEDLASN